MNFNKLIKRKLHFLIERGYSFSHNCEKGLFHEFEYQKDDYCIAISYDSRCEFLDLTIKNKTHTLIKTTYDCVVINNLNWQEKEYAHLLKDIYLLPHNSFSISQKQFMGLIDLYVDCIISFVDQKKN